MPVLQVVVAAVAAVVGKMQRFRYVAAVVAAAVVLGLGLPVADGKVASGLAVHCC